MAELVATIAIRPLVSMLMNKASSYLLDQYNVMEGLEKQHKILKRKLPAILDVITDAEEQATAHREGAKAWLQELKTVAYEAHEVFDEFKYEALRREAKKKGHYIELGFDVIKLFPTHNRIVFRYNMGRKLCRILQAVEELIAEMHAFRFKYRPQPLVFKEWRHTDYVIIDPQEIARRSRREDKKYIVDKLLGEASSSDLAVVPIVGMGGLGKTTLAQLIYNEPGIQKHFQLRLWVCVSDTSDVNSLAKSIVETAPMSKDDTETRDKQPPPLDSLQKLVHGKRYLLVLDDVWNRGVQMWERLKVCLQHGGTGSAVLITTRDKRVAEIMGADRVYSLNALENSFIKEIIEARAFSSENEKPPELLEMVGEIVKRCRGSPLAATALGSILRARTSVEEWKVVSSRSSICTEETGILPILKLSYNDLPSHMKLCFAFCAVFPKDYKIDVAKLIRLWIANGFIPEHKEDSLETIGQLIFDELTSRSFFLDIEKCKDSRGYYSITTCKIHDLMHDIAMSVMEKECIVVTMKPSEIECLGDTSRHLFLSCEEMEGILNDSLEKGSPAIQTLIGDNHVQSSLKHLSKYSSLHALKLCIRGTESFLLRAMYLHHLRYLDLSNSDVKALPEDISILYNLQVLDLSNCYRLDQLPRQMKYMTSLRHLYTHGCWKLKSMPPGLRKLTNLQTLTCFVAGVHGPDCSDVGELHDLKIGGQLELCQVENVEKAEAEVANLGNKKDLNQLALRWSKVGDRKVLDNFEPHGGLQVLEVHYYGGECMGMLQNMVEIHLFHCERLQLLFRCSTIFTFPRLKVLTLDHLLGFERWVTLKETQGEQILFPRLQELSIEECPKLTALPETPFPALKVLQIKRLESFQRWDAAKGEHILFPQLEKLSVQKCPKIINLPQAPKLSVLEIEDGKQEICHCVDRYSSSLNNLILKLDCTSIVPVESKEKWNQNSFFGAGAPEPSDYFKHLLELEISGCDVLIHWPEKVFQSLVSLRRLGITNCKKLVGYAKVPLESSTTERSQCLSGLESLELKDCASLVEMFNIPVSLMIMDIESCPKLESIFGKQQGMSESIEGSSCSEAIVHAAVSELPSSPMINFCPRLESLRLSACESLPAVLNLPPSLKTLKMYDCSSIQVLTCQPGGLQNPEATTSTSRRTIMPEPPPAAAATAAREHLLPPHLECLVIQDRAGMLGGTLRLPTPLKRLDIIGNSGLTSLEYLSGDHPSSLAVLDLRRCSTLASLPNEPQVYKSLSYLGIRGCPAIKKLPRCLHQQLGSIKYKEVDAHYEVMALKPKTWKEIPRLVRERRKAAREARESQRSTRQE